MSNELVNHDPTRLVYPFFSIFALQIITMKPDYLMFGQEAMKKLIPQRKPMIMVEGLVSSDSTSTVSALLIGEENIFVSDGLFSESGLIENMAQTAALRSGYEAGLHGTSPMVGFIGAVKKLQINRLPRVGEQLLTEVNLVSELLGAMVVHAITRVEGETIAEADLSIFLSEQTDKTKKA